MIRDTVRCFAVLLVLPATVAAQDLPPGYPPVLKELQSVPRLVRQHSRQARESNAATETVAQARTACDAAMLAWNAWVDALTASLTKRSDPLRSDFPAKSEEAAKGAITCAVPRLAAANLSPLSEKDLATEEKRLRTNLQQTGQRIWRDQSRGDDAKRGAAVIYLRETLHWAAWDDAR